MYLNFSIISHQGNEDRRDLFDAECLKLINEYFYGVRIFPGQDPAHVYIGWVTTQYHIHDTAFDQSKVRSVIVQEYTEDGDVKSSWVFVCRTTSKILYIMICDEFN